MKAVKSDITDIKTDMRGMRDQLNVFGREVNAEFRAMRAEHSASVRWIVGISIAGFAGMLAVMAKGFGWY